MKLLRMSACTFVCLLIAAVLQAVNMQGAVAVTPYDNVIVLDDDLIIGAGNASEDVSGSIVDYLNTPSAYEGSGVCSGWATMFRSQYFSSYRIVYISNPGGNQRVHIGWVHKSTGSEKFSFESDGGQGRVFKSSPLENYNQITLYKNANGDTRIGCGSWYSGSPNGTAATVYAGYYMFNSNYYSIASTNFPIEYPDDYEGLMVPQPEKAQYVALGDSYSSGEGNGPYYAWTDTSSNKCHQSEGAYPELLQADLAFATSAIAACSGATTDTLLNGGSGAGAWGRHQMAELSSQTQNVTITVGGNDIGFADYAEQCVATLCGPLTTPYTFIMAEISNPTFQDNLVNTYEEILDRAPSAQVYAAGYPYLAPENAMCGGGVDLSGAYYVQSALNDVIEAAVEEADSNLVPSRIQYVDPNLSGSPFDERYLCGGTESSDFYGVNISSPEESFHPNASGQAHYAELFVAAMQ